MWIVHEACGGGELKWAEGWVTAHGFEVHVADAEGFLSGSMKLLVVVCEVVGWRGREGDVDEEGVAAHVGGAVVNSEYLLQVEAFVD